MATTPRYVGSTTAAAVAYIQARLGTDRFLRVYDLDGDGVVASGSADETALVAGICEAETEIDEALSASHAAPFTGTIQDSIKEIAYQRALWCSVRLRANANNDHAPFLLLYQQTEKRLERLARDNRARLPSTGAPAPIAGAVGYVSTGDGGTPWTDAANGTETSGF